MHDGWDSLSHSHTCKQFLQCFITENREVKSNCKFQRAISNCNMKGMNCGGCVALYAIPTGLILRFLTQSLRFCCCSFDLDCGFFSFSIFFGWIVGIENFAGFWIWVWILWWSGWFCRSGVFWVDLVVLVDGVFVDFTWIEFIDVFLLNSVDLVYIGVMDLLVLGWLQIELRGN